MALNEIAVIISALCGLVGTLGGILISNKVTLHRIDQLEKKVDKHNNVIERLYVCEGNVKELQHEIIDLKKR